MCNAYDRGPSITIVLYFIPARVWPVFLQGGMGLPVPAQGSSYRYERIRGLKKKVTGMVENGPQNLDLV